MLNGIAERSCWAKLLNDCQERHNTVHKIDMSFVTGVTYLLDFNVAVFMCSGWDESREEVVGRPLGEFAL